MLLPQALRKVSGPSHPQVGVNTEKEAAGKKEMRQWEGDKQGGRVLVQKTSPYTPLFSVLNRCW